MKKMLLLLAVAGAAVSGMAEKPFAPKSIVFGHMGERVEAPENTLRAYRFAIDNGFPIEFDIYMTKDGCAYFAPRWDNLLVTRDVVEAAHANGMKVCVWAVDDAGLALEALRRGVDYVMSNRPNGLYAEMLAAQRE